MATGDLINHPPHYTYGGIEVIDFIEALTLGYHEGNVVKYVCRWQRKGGVEDLKKARWYLKRLIEKIEGEADTEDLPKPIIDSPTLGKLYHADELPTVADKCRSVVSMPGESAKQTPEEYRVASAKLRRGDA